MQEEVNEKTISLCIKGGKITAKILKAALIKLLAEMDKKKKQQEKGKGQCKRTGKQSMEPVLLRKSTAENRPLAVCRPRRWRCWPNGRPKSRTL